MIECKRCERFTAGGNGILGSGSFYSKTTKTFVKGRSCRFYCVSFENEPKFYEQDLLQVQSEQN